MKTAKRNGQSKLCKRMGSSKAPENLILLAGSINKDSHYPLSPCHSICRLRKPSDPIGKCFCAVDSGSCRSSQLVKAERISYCGVLCHKRTSGSHPLPKAQGLWWREEGTLWEPEVREDGSITGSIRHGRAAHSNWGCQTKTGSWFLTGTWKCSHRVACDVLAYVYIMPCLNH